HLSFQVMIAVGTFFMLFSSFLLFKIIRKKDIFSPRLLKIMALSTPFGFIAVEAGWMVTELGRQPWIIYKIMKTKDAITPMPGIAYSFWFFTALYILLGVVVSWLFMRQIRKYQS
ncbi:MAG TPA: cytochrome ubiquinol oxidase subunit I, partial [Sulfurimonas sp.]|nr:cytochrome ubiquinol oxidase subunit I [Sulfurimonas sp.]